MCVIESFVNELEKINKFHSIYVNKQLDDLNKQEKESFISLLNYFINTGFDIHFMVHSYNNMVKDSIVHQRYFVTHDDYMFHSFQEVNAAIYNNPTKMQEYLTGLSISHYLWHNHITLNRYFIEQFNNFLNSNICSHKHYLEVGPGYGECFLYALNHSDFLFYEGVDVSDTSVKNCTDYLHYNLSLKNNTKEDARYKIVKQDFFEYDTQQKVDAFVCSEVLEHIEAPSAFLKKISQIIHKDSFVYLTTAINAPSSGHIYLFRNIEDVFNMVNDAGLFVEDYICVGNTNEANSNKQANRPLLTAMVLKKVEKKS